MWNESCRIWRIRWALTLIEKYCKCTRSFVINTRVSRIWRSATTTKLGSVMLLPIIILLHTVDLKQHGFISWSIVRHSVYELVRIPSRMYKYYNVGHSLQLYYNTPLDDCYKDRAECGVCIIHRLNTRITCQHTSLCHITWSWLHWERT